MYGITAERENEKMTKSQWVFSIENSAGALFVQDVARMEFHRMFSFVYCFCRIVSDLK